MSDHNSQRKLPPLSPKPTASENDLEERTVKKTKKKKSARSRSEHALDNAPNERSPSRQNKHRDSTHRESVRDDQENVNPANPAASPAKKKKKKKPPSASREQLMSGDEVLSDRSNRDHQTSAKKTKKKKKKRVIVSETEDEPADDLAEFEDLKEDVVIADEGEQTMMEEQPVWTQPTMRSEPISKVFIEQRGGFKSKDKQKLARRREDEAARHRDAQLLAPTGIESTMQLALATQHYFHKLAWSVEGLFCGLAIGMIILVYTLSSTGYDNLLENYSGTAAYVQAFYFFLFVLCTVDMFDRYDIGRPSGRMLKRAFTLQSGAIVCVFYLAGLIISVSIAATDDKISLYREDDTLWEDEEARDSELSTWRILHLVRSLCVVIPWFIICFCIKPTTHRLRKNLIKADENMLMMDTTTQYHAQPDHTTAAVTGMTGLHPV